MKSLLKRLASKLPEQIILEMKRLYYAWNIKHSTFSTKEKEYNLLHTWIDAGDWVVDIGANIGQYIKRMSDLVGNKGRVIAFEPISETFYLLTSNVNRFRNKNNVSLFNAAVSDKTELLGMEMPKFDTGLVNYYEAHLVSSSTDRTVLCIRIDDFNFPEKIKLVKIDAEGHEFSAIKGMKNVIERDHPVLIVEEHGDEVENYLCTYGYEKKWIEHSANIIFT